MGQACVGRQRSYLSGIVCPLGERSEWLLGRDRQASTGSSPTPRSRTPRSHPDVSIKWFEDGMLNVCRQLHRPPPEEARRPGRDHLGGRRSRRTTSRSPIASCTSGSASFANVLKAKGVKKGDRVTIYMPMIPRRPTRCWLARASARSIRWCSAASRPTALPGASATAESKLVITADEGCAAADRSAQEERRRGAEERRGRSRRCSWSAAPAASRHARRAATSGCTKSWPRSMPTARPRR